MGRIHVKVLSHDDIGRSNALITHLVTPRACAAFGREIDDPLSSWCFNVAEDEIRARTGDNKYRYDLSLMQFQAVVVGGVAIEDFAPLTRPLVVSEYRPMQAVKSKRNVAHHLERLFAKKTKNGR